MTGIADRVPPEIVKENEQDVRVSRRRVRLLATTGQRQQSCDGDSQSNRCAPRHLSSPSEEDEIIAANAQQFTTALLFAVGAA